MSFDTSSPASASLNTSYEVTLSYFLKDVSTFVDTASIPLLPIAVPEDKASKHPKLPQLHLGPLGSTVVCPISSALQVFPLYMLPFKTAPPPTPVLTVKYTI